MRKALFFGAAAVLGFALGILAFFVGDFSLHSTFVAAELGVWREYGPLLFSALGASSGVFLAKVLYKSSTQAHVPIHTPPVKIAAPSRRKCRPLTWSYRV